MAGGVTTLVCVIVLIVLCFITLKTITPPPPPKKTIMIELTTAGGGGGGGQPQVASSSHKAHATAKNIATENRNSAPSVPKGTSNESTSNEPKINPNATYGKRGTGTGGGAGSGSGTGTGSGFGPGEGGGSGGGIGYGTGRSMMNHLNLNIGEQGVVVVEVHINPDGTVAEAKVISQYGQYKTTITNAKIRKDCENEAKKARYAKGKEELGIIIFK